MSGPVFDVTVIGHFAVDSILLPSNLKAFNMLGGSAAYSSLAAKRLGASVSVVSKVGEDFPEAYLWWLHTEGIDVSAVQKIANAPSTRFELVYNADFSDRTLRLISRAPCFSVTDVSGFPATKAVHVAPIAGEIPLEAVELLRCRGDLLALDAQGLVRSFDAEGRVAFGAPVDARFLGLVDVVKGSADEICALTGKNGLSVAVEAMHCFGPKIVIATLGSEGALLSNEGTIYKVPVYPVQQIVDPTGAGDVFMGGFLAEYVKDKDLLWSACVASAAASLVVQGFGPTFLGEKEEIYRRACVLYEKEIKQ